MRKPHCKCYNVIFKILLTGGILYYYFILLLQKLNLTDDLILMPACPVYS